MLMADSTLKQFRSGIFSSAIFLIMSLLTTPIFLRLGSAEPACFLVYSSNKACTGGVLMINSKLLSVYTVITTGNTLPILSWVRALNCLQNSIMLTPFEPNAGPIGG